MKCPMCDKKLEGRQKYCSAACRKKASRQSFTPEKLEEILAPLDEALAEVPSHKISTPRVEPKSGPQKGDADWPGSEGWWVYGTIDDPNKTWDRVCVRCGKTYTTPLELMRFCSDECKSEVMIVVANGPHENYKKWAKLDV